jgi:hypothetical protein
MRCGHNGALEIAKIFTSESRIGSLRSLPTDPFLPSRLVAESQFRSER